MMGNALIQPMMYFNLRNVPMFSGPYMITKVSHEISEGEFKTNFTGTRQPFYSLPKIDNFIQSLSVNLISKIKEQIQKQENETKNFSGNVITESVNVVSNVFGTEKLTSNQNCSDKLNNSYLGYTTVDAPKVTKKTLGEMNNEIKNRLVNIGLKPGVDQLELDLRTLLFIFFYLDTGNQTGFQAYENNFGSVNLTETYGPSFITFINKKYFCISKSNSINVPLVSFPTSTDFIDFAISKIKPSIGSYENNRTIENAVKQYVNLWANVKNPDVYNKLTEQDIININAKANKASEIFNSLNP
jgi:hypothetical protein